MKIFIDSDAFIALLNKADSLHYKAKNLLKELGLGKNPQEIEFITSWDVVDEVATKISYRLTKTQAVAFFEFLSDINTSIVYPNASFAKQAQAVFKTIISKKVSMTDCMNMIVVKELKLDYIFSFDKIYQKQGLRLLVKS